MQLHILSQNFRALLGLIHCTVFAYMQASKTIAFWTRPARLAHVTCHLTHCVYLLYIPNFDRAIGIFILERVESDYQPRRAHLLPRLRLFSGAIDESVLGSEKVLVSNYFLNIGDHHAYMHMHKPQRMPKYS